MQPTVLLVDDDHNLRIGLVRALRKQPYQILTASSAAEAMMCMKCSPVHVIVSDDQMSGMSGVDLLTWVAQHFPGTARMMLTGKATATSAIKAINDANVFRYFTKPCNVVDLALAIRQALDQAGADNHSSEANAAAAKK